MKIKISHNKKLFWTIIILIVFLCVLIYFIAKSKKIGENETEICQIDSDCVPADCCHADKCVTKDKKPNCSDIFCSQVCSGPLDCGAGHCGCVNNQCEIISD